MNYIKKNKRQFLLIIYILMFIIFVLKPVSFDVKIYIEAAERACKIGKFPNNIVEAWEHKYILNRLLFFIMVKIVKIFVNENRIMLFEIVIKMLYGLIGIIIIECFSKNTKSLFEKYGINKETVFGVLYFAIIGSGIYFSLQTEMTAFLITLIAIIFVLKEKMYCKILSGFIISTLFWFKGVTILYSVIILAIMILCNHKKKDIISVISSSVIFLLIELLLMYSFYPNEIKTMYLATKYMTKQITLTGILSFLERFNMPIQYICMWRISIY